MTYFFNAVLAITFFSTTAAAKTHTVKMFNLKNGQSMIFEPGFLKIKQGDEVKFVPTDKEHNSQSVFMPKGAKKWTGEFGKVTPVKFTADGIYVYECSAHSMMGMAGIIQVGDGNAKNLAPAKKFLKKYKKNLIMNKNRVNDLINALTPKKP